MSKLFPYTHRMLAATGQATALRVSRVGQWAQLSAQVLRWLVKGHCHKQAILVQTAFVLQYTWPIAVILNIFTGMILALELSGELVRQGGSDYVGALMVLALVRELAPIMMAMATVAMAGSAFSAELASLKVGLQVDALHMMGVHPVRYLGLPRVLACVLAAPVMGLVSTYAGLWGGQVTSHWLAELPAATYWDSVWQQLTVTDVGVLLLKCVVFGALVGLWAMAMGLSAYGGARAVGQASTRTVVASFASVALADYLIPMWFYGGISP